MSTNAPTLDLFNGHSLAMDVWDPCWLYAGTLTELDGDGRSWRFTYRSPMLRLGDPLYQRMLDFVGGALPVGDPQIVNDPQMMFGQAEMSIYEPRCDVLAMAQ